MPPEQDDSADRDDAGVLSPDELDISDDENAVEIEDGRYVISAGGDPPTVPSTVSSDSTGEADESRVEEAGMERASAGGSTGTARESTTGAPGDVTEEAVRAWLEESVDAAGSQYGFDVTATFEGSVSQQQLYSNDVSTTFENLIVWYARHVGGDTPVEEVLGLLLLESNVSVTYPTETVTALVREYGLSHEDSIADLFEALAERERVTFPP